MLRGVAKKFKKKKKEREREGVRRQNPLFVGAGGHDLSLFS